MKIRLLGAYLFYADRLTDGRTDGQTDMMRLIVAFRNNTNAPKTETSGCTLRGCNPIF